MSFGKMTQQIEIQKVAKSKDADGFATDIPTTIAKMRAYKEEKNGSEKWVNYATFGNVTTLFRFRYIKGIPITAECNIVCKGDTYKIIHIENVRERNMYVEALCERVIPSG